MAPGDRHDLVHPTTLAGEMHRHDGHRARRDAGLKQRWVEISGWLLNLREHRDAARGKDSVRRRNEGEAGDDHFALSARGR